jgi:UDP-N-acetylglucosamine 4,6-dehydratase/UDP-glucose 4-epimerase
VELVITAMENSETLRGTVVTREMKSALIGDILNLWIADRGGSWKQIARRPGDRHDESIMGESERPYARVAEFDRIKHYIISFDQRADTLIDDGLSSEDAPRLTDKEIRAILDNPPSAEELH